VDLYCLDWQSSNGISSSDIPLEKRKLWGLESDLKRPATLFGYRRLVLTVYVSLLAVKYREYLLGARISEPRWGSGIIMPSGH